MPRFLSFFTMVIVLLAQGLQQTTAGNVLDDPDFDAAAALLKALPKSSSLGGLLAAASPEGHWVFVNADGEQATAADKAEVDKLLPVLVPDFGKARDNKVTFLLTPKTAFERRGFLNELPEESHFRLFYQGQSLALEVLPGEHPGLTVERALGLVTPIETAEKLSEIDDFLARPIARWAVRLLTLEPGAARFLPDLRPRGPDGEVPVAEAADPYKVKDVFRSISGNTALITGVIEDQLLRFQPGDGHEQTVIIADLEKAAANADVDLLLIDTGTPRQPGVANMLWQTMALSKAGEVVASRTIKDLLIALAGGNGRLRIGIPQPPSGARLRLELKSVDGSSGGLLPALTGELTPVAIQASVRTTARVIELNRRLLPGIPSKVQFTYLGLFGLGLLGWPVALRWWRAFGFNGIAGGVVFVLAFVPLLSPATVLWRLVGGRRGTLAIKG